MESTPQVKGPVIPVRKAPRPIRRMRSRHSFGYWFPILLILAVGIWVELVVTALRRQETDCLPAVVSGVGLWLLEVGYSYLFDKTNKREWDRVKAIANQLEERTRSGEFGPLPPDSSPLGWLTVDGIYFPYGAYFP